MFYTGIASRFTGILRLCSLLLVMAGIASSVLAQSSNGAEAQLNINVTRIISPVSPTLYGLMTEEINHSYDGGLYAEMIQNRAFHANWEGTPPWDLVRRGNAVASRSFDKSTGPSEALPYSMKLTVASASDGNEAGLSNPGYWGYGLRPNTTYSGSLYAREDADIGPLTVEMINNATGAVEAQAQVAVKPGRIQTHHRSNFAFNREPSGVHRQPSRRHLVPAGFAHAANLQPSPQWQSS
jgi:alpha-N-arabinofuranosidase